MATSAKTHPSLSVRVTFLAARLHLNFSDLCVRSLERSWLVYVESQHVNWAGNCILWRMSFLSDLLDESLSATQGTQPPTLRDIIYMRTISEVESLLAFLLLVFLCRIAVVTREVGAREPVIPLSPTASSPFLCISDDPDIALAPTRASTLGFNALVSSRTTDSPRYGTLATPTWSTESNSCRSAQ